MMNTRSTISEGDDVKLGKDACIINMVDLIQRVEECLKKRDWNLLKILLKDLKITHESKG